MPIVRRAPHTNPMRDKGQISPILCYTESELKGLTYIAQTMYLFIMLAHAFQGTRACTDNWILIIIIFRQY